MKKLIRLFMLAVVLLFGSVNYASAATPLTGPGPGDKQAELYAHIVNRVHEIQAMDKSNLSASDKKALRKELKEMKKQTDGLDHKVYLSIGAIIIIILLLILILR